MKKKNALQDSNVNIISSYKLTCFKLLHYFIPNPCAVFIRFNDAVWFTNDL